MICTFRARSILTRTETILQNVYGLGCHQAYAYLEPYRCVRHIRPSLATISDLRFPTNESRYLRKRAKNERRLCFIRWRILQSKICRSVVYFSSSIQVHRKRASMFEEVRSTKQFLSDKQKQCITLNQMVHSGVKQRIVLKCKQIKTHFTSEQLMCII